MRTILIIGAGKSTAYLIKYFLDKSQAENLKVVLADQNIELAKKRIGNHPNGQAIYFDVFNVEQRKTEIQKADIVVSMLPARFHLEVAIDCLIYGKDMFIASYGSKDM